MELIKRISGSLNAYEGYLRSKNCEKTKNKLPIEEAKKLMDYIDKDVEELKKWLKEKKIDKTKRGFIKTDAETYAKIRNRSGEKRCYPRILGKRR